MDHGQGQTATAEPVETYEALAKIIDHLALSPELTDDDVAEHCRLAREYDVATIIVRPSDVDQAVRWMGSSAVRVGSTVGYPDGSANTATKLYEGRDLLRRGVKELDMTVNIGKLISRQFQYVETELMQMAKSCLDAGAVLKVNLGSRFLADDLKIIATKICRRVEATYIAVDWDPAAIEVFRPILKDQIEMKAVTINTLDDALAVRAAGCKRAGSVATAGILTEWKTRLAAARPAAGQPAAT